MTTNEQLNNIAEDCDHLSQQIRNVGVKMESWSVNPEMTQHAKELFGAADMAREWAKKLRIQSFDGRK